MTTRAEIITAATEARNIGIMGTKGRLAVVTPGATASLAGDPDYWASLTFALAAATANTNAPAKRPVA